MIAEFLLVLVGAVGGGECSCGKGCVVDCFGWGRGEVYNRQAGSVCRGRDQSAGSKLCGWLGNASLLFLQC